MNTYKGIVTFCGVGDTEYEVQAKDMNEAIGKIFEEARMDLYSEIIDDGEYQISFSDDINAENTYYCENEFEALEEAEDNDLRIEEVYIVE